MSSSYVDQLKSSDAARRREAIIALGKSNSADALAPLAEVYRNDPDESLRELALKAGRYLRQQTADAAPVAVASARNGGAERLEREPSEYDDIAEAKRPPLVLPKKVIKAGDISLSRSLTNEALTHNANNDNAKALKALRNAIKVNPEIIDDQFFLGVAGSVTDRDGKSAIAMLLDEGEYTSKVKESKQALKQSKIDKHMATARESKWSGVAIEAVIFFLLNAIALVVLTLVIAEAGKAQVAMTPEEYETARESLGSLQNIVVSFEALTTLSLPSLIGVGVIIAVGALISMVIFGLLLHLIAKLFNGKGTMPFLYDKLFGHYNLRLPQVYGIIAVGYYVTFGFGVIYAALVLAIGLFRFVNVNRRAVGVLRQVYNLNSVLGLFASIVASLAISFVLFFINFIVSAILLGFIF